MRTSERVHQLDARLRAAPDRGETWTAFYSRLSKRRELNRVPLFMVIRELSEKVQRLEDRVAELEAAHRDTVT